MSVTILYRHPLRPDEAGMTRVPYDGYAAAALTDELVKRGYRVVEIVRASATPHERDRVLGC